MDRPEKSATPGRVKDRAFINAYGTNRASRRAAKSMKRKEPKTKPER